MACSSAAQRGARRKLRRQHRADFAWRDLAAERRAERNRDDLQHRMCGRRQQGAWADRAALANRLADTDERLAEPEDGPPTDARHHAACRQRGEAASRRRARDAFEEVLGRAAMSEIVAIGHVLDEVEQQGEQRRPPRPAATPVNRTTAANIARGSAVYSSAPAGDVPGIAVSFRIAFASLPGRAGR